MERFNDPIMNALDALLQFGVGPRETRPDPGLADAPQVFRDFSGMTEIDECMSNCDHSIDAGMEEKLRANPGQVFSRHAAWNFNGKVWFENDAFYSEIWVYGSPRQTFSASSLRELMDRANDEYGHD